MQDQHSTTPRQHSTTPRQHPGTLSLDEAKAVLSTLRRHEDKPGEVFWKHEDRGYVAKGLFSAMFPIAAVVTIELPEGKTTIWGPEAWELYEVGMVPRLINPRDF